MTVVAVGIVTGTVVRGNGRAGGRSSGCRSGRGGHRSRGGVGEGARASGAAGLTVWLPANAVVVVAPVDVVAPAVVDDGRAGGAGPRSASTGRNRSSAV